MTPCRLFRFALVFALVGGTVASASAALQTTAVQLPAGELVWGGFTGEFSAADETFAIAGAGWPELAGRLALDGDQAVLTLDEAPEGCREPGRYEVAVAGDTLSFSLVADDCTPRRMILDASRWRPAGSVGPPTPRALSLEPAAAPPILPEPAPAHGAWPMFRGPSASGIADGQNLPDQWNGETGENVRWKVPVPGLAHSSPVVWGDRVFVTSAISGDPDASFRPGLYGDGDASADRTTHRWMIYAFNKHDGELAWERVAHEGVPRNRRHVKSTYASSSPATDGRVVVAWFGSEGLFAYTVEGEFLWRLDLGRVDVGAYDIPSFEWGPASSPIVWNGNVYLQVDTQQDSFLVALDAASGELLWRTERDELPSWGSPNVLPGDDGPVLVTNASNFIRGYDPHTGEELWRLGGSSKITAPTPIHADGHWVVASGRRPEQPIFVLRPGGRGDLTLADGDDSSDAVAWSLQRRGPYMPTPLALDGILYVLGNNGVFDAYELATGEEIYRQRIPHLGSGFSASPVAADGKIYLSNEDGEIVVVRAGREFEHVATNSMGELLMATPALSEGVMYVRSVNSLFAVGAPEAER